jgi:uncharacterized repeat protein (TIGR01451 family)/TQXA domain-containing protein
MRLARLALSVVLALATLLPQASRVEAVISPESPPVGVEPFPSGPPYDIRLSGLGPGQAVTGAIANDSSSFDPTSTPYPDAIPPNFSFRDEGFAGVIYGQPHDESQTLTLYCIDILTNTYVGIEYQLGTWDAATVPRVGFVTRILNEYYPHNPSEPAGLSQADQAAAVQAAIWYFSDRYVLLSSDRLHDAVAQIVNHVLDLGPVPAPEPPGLTVTPASLSGPAGSPVGPFTVTSTTGQATVSALGNGRMYADSAGTQPISENSVVASGQQIWVSSPNSSTVSLQATATVTVPRGNVYLHVGDPAAYQRLILSDDATLSSTATAFAQFLPTGSLVVTKSIAGEGAQLQGEIRIEVSCNGTLQQPVFVIPAGTAAGQRSQTYNNLPLGASCTVSETSDGSNSSVTVTVDGSGQQVLIPAEGGGVAAGVTDTFALVPSPTPTPTNTPTPTLTPSPSSTPTSTGTATLMLTATATPTVSATATATLTASATATSTAVGPSATPTGTPTSCVTPEPSPTATPSAVAPTPTSVPSATLQPSATSTSTATSSSTPQPGATATATATPQPGGGSGGGTSAVSAPSSASTLTVTATATLAATSTPTSTRTATPTPEVAGVEVEVAPGAPTPVRAAVLIIEAITVQRLREGPPSHAPAQVPNPPVQLPPGAESLWDMVTAVFAAQPIGNDQNPCALDVSMSSSVDPSAASPGEQVEFNYVISNTGSVPLALVQVESSLPNGLDFVSASGGGAVDPATGYVSWRMPSGLPVGGTTTVSLAALVSASGALTNLACSAGSDAAGNDASHCASATVAVGVPTPTPTLTPTPTIVVTPSLTATGTPTATPTPHVALPTVLPATPTSPPTATAVTPPTATSVPTPQPTPTAPPPTATPEPPPEPAPLPEPAPAPEPAPVSPPETTSTG